MQRKGHDRAWPRKVVSPHWPIWVNTAYWSFLFLSGILGLAAIISDVYEFYFAEWKKSRIFAKLFKQFTIRIIPL